MGGAWGEPPRGTWDELLCLPLTGEIGGRGNNKPLPSYLGGHRISSCIPPLMGGASIRPSSLTQWEGTGYCLSLKRGSYCPSYPTWVLFFCPRLWVRHTSPLVGLVFFCVPTSLGETYIPPSESFFFAHVSG